MLHPTVPLRRAANRFRVNRDNRPNTTRPIGNTAIPGQRGPAGAPAESGLAILIVTSEAPPVVSGISTAVAVLRRGLTEHGHHVDVVSRDDYPRFIRGEFRFSAFAFYWPALRRRLSTYDVVNLHGPVPTISEVFLLLIRTLRRHQRPAIVYTHHSDLSITSLERACSIYNGIAGRVAQSADAIVVSSAAYHAKLDRPQGKPVSIIPWAVDSAGRQLSQRTGAGKGARPGRLRVLFVGQLRGYKGLHVLLDAVTGLGNVSLTIVGDGPLRSELDGRVAEAGLTNVRLIGRLSDADLRSAYATHEVIVLPSTTTAEAYGLVLAEGMAAGCVPVASALPGVSELAQDTGLLVRPGDPRALRAAFRTLADEPRLVDKLSAASLERAQHLSVDAMALNYERVFRSALATTGVMRAQDAVPAGWDCPADLLAQLAEVIGINRTSLSHVWRTPGTSSAEIWIGGAEPFRGAAPTARLVANLGRPILHSPGLQWDRRLPPLIRRPGSTSSILLPVHWTRRGVSVVELWTTEEDAVVLGVAELSKVLALVTTTGPAVRSACNGAVRTGDYADMASQAVSTSRARADQSISLAAAAPSPEGSFSSERR
jgi:rhamnosyl/mannosyltransferase